MLRRSIFGLQQARVQVNREFARCDGVGKQGGSHLKTVGWEAEHAAREVIGPPSSVLNAEGHTRAHKLLPRFDAGSRAVAKKQKLAYRAKFSLYVRVPAREITVKSVP
jgi:hypothetical protein